MSVREELVALQEELASGYAPDDRVKDEDSARLAAIVRKAALRRGLPAKALHALVEALLEAVAP